MVRKFKLLWLALLILPLFGAGFKTDGLIKTGGLIKISHVTVGGGGGGGGCTDGVDCFCDRVSDPGDPLYDPSLLFCEDFEDSQFYTDTSPNWVLGSGSPYNRGLNSLWLTRYGGNADLGPRSSDPSPYIGTACGLSRCSGIREYCSEQQGLLTSAGLADCWGPGANSGSCIDIQRSGDFNAELGTLTLSGGKGEAPDVGAGNQHLAERWGPNNTCGISGTATFPASTEVGITRAVAIATNMTASGLNSTYLKFDEWGNGSSDSNIEFWSLGNLVSVGDSSHFPFRSFIFTGTKGASNASRQADCLDAISGATVHLGGGLSCGPSDDIKFTYRPDSSLYQQTRDWPLGQWKCVKSHISGMGTTNLTVKIYFGDTLITHISGIDGTKVTNQNYTLMSYGSYANYNAGQGVGPSTVPTYRYMDNVHIRAGEPVACSAIGY